MGIPSFNIPAKRQITKETNPMKLTWHGHSAFCIEASKARIFIDPFLSDSPSWDKGWSGYLEAKNSTQGGDR
jgi:L-ascorbate metabolism protein UlaG (beta-lactamase superfamily)